MEQIMRDIPQLIKMLQDNDHNRRYEACEELSVLRHHLPQVAIAALIVAKDDSNPAVADAAKRALAVHTELEKSDLEVFDKNSPSVKPLTMRQTILIGALVGGVSISMLYIREFSGVPDYLMGLVIYAFVGTILGMPGAIIGRHLGKNRISIISGSVIGIILEVVCLKYLALRCLFGC
jgi:hypothetical protein